jgi:phosphatidylserine decarboxylase
MRFHKEGYTPLALCILFIFVLNALIQFYFPQANAFKWIIYILSFLFFVAIILFFRSPSVNIAPDEKAVLSPADGKIVSIGEVEETEFLKDRRIQVSIAIAPTDVHVNRNPVTGVVKFVKQNGHTTIAVANTAGITILYRQLPGSLSKRIITYTKQGDAVKQGEQFGFSALGSRVDVLLPVGTKLNVELNAVVKGGLTALAYLKS